MPIPTHTVTCTHKALIARDIYELRFTKPAGFSFKPGQFVLFRLPLIDKPDDVQTRAFSIASSPDEAELLFAMKMKEGGRASRWIEEVVEVGKAADMQGPFGFFTLNSQSPKEYLFVATSTGIAPFRSQAISVLAAGEKRRIDLIFGVRSEEDLFWKEEMESLTKKYENFFLHLALSQPSDAWTGHKGRVQTLAPLIAPDFSRKNIYVCGSPEMTKDLKEICLNMWSVPKEDIHIEGYI